MRKGWEEFLKMPSVEDAKKASRIQFRKQVEEREEAIKRGEIDPAEWTAEDDNWPYVIFQICVFIISILAGK